jgi:hypothetical protein
MATFKGSDAAMMKKLDDILGSYERRKQIEEKAAADKAVREQREREAALVVFRQRLIPPLHAIVRAIRERGHEASVAEFLEDEYPHVSMDFTPARRASGVWEPLGSRLLFTYKGGETVETLQEVARSASRGITEKWRLFDVGEDWVHRQVLGVVEHALRNH